MSHRITALLIPGPCASEAARTLDLVPVPLAPPWTLVHVDHYYTAYWQAVRGCTQSLDVPTTFPAVFPREAVVVQLVQDLTGLAAPRFVLVKTEYFGDVGAQWACAFTGTRRDSVDGATINDALRLLGLVRRDPLDELDTLGLGEHRSSPDHLERHIELCEALGV